MKKVEANFNKEVERICGQVAKMLEQYNGHPLKIVIGQMAAEVIEKVCAEARNQGWTVRYKMESDQVDSWWEMVVE